MQDDIGDRVAEWSVRLSDGMHVVHFDHGTTTGKRVIYIDNKEILRREWMFKLVGNEHFTIGKAECCIRIQALNSFAYEYSMEVNGKSLKKFTENQSKILRSWIVPIQGDKTRIVLERDTLDVWMNGLVLQTTAEFTDAGCETHFAIDEANQAYISAISSGKRKSGILHKLYVNETLIPETHE